MHNISLLLLFSLVINSSHARAEETTSYKLKKGDRLSELLYQKGFKPLYGKKGFVKKAVLLNGGKIKAEGNLIRAGEFILLPTPTNEVKAPSENVKIDEAVTLEIPTQSESDNTHNQKVLEPYDRKDDVVFTISPSLSWYKFITDTKKTNQDYDITALSKASLGIDLHFKKSINQDLNYYLFGKLNNIKFYSDTAYLFTKSPLILKKYGGGIEYKLGSANDLSLEASIDDQIFLELIDTNTIRPKLMSVPVFTLLYSDEVFKFNDIGIGYGLLAKILLPHDSSLSETGMGHGMGAELFAKKSQFGLKFFYYYDQARALGQSSKTYDIGWSALLAF